LLHRAGSVIEEASGTDVKKNAWATFNCVLTTFPTIQPLSAVATGVVAGESGFANIGWEWGVCDILHLGPPINEDVFLAV
jgi:hypothetical protein